VKERGVVAVELALSVLVLLVPVAILVLSFAPVLERRALARSFAVEVARSMVISSGEVRPGVERMLWQAGVAGSALVRFGSRSAVIRCERSLMWWVGARSLDQVSRCRWRSRSNPTCCQEVRQW
jgi:hypothetical protein